MNWTLEVVVVPVSDVARSVAFYAGGLGFAVDHDTVLGGGWCSSPRPVQAARWCWATA
ncbi:VOC family protein [Deinococcus multiflagellatus]|uniref:VOC family protein n=1 Tax=Deinococcus multiflagellatus TaxID=1656887 RepID=A0ABW1ZK32_9DEIO|nr:VOC family protein [Deinococcus multiflagellatus]MBZ9712411.1 VOC family protein [Deinococcus multiflagellatus]